MAISRWVFDRSLQKYLAGGFYDPDIEGIATTFGRNPADCEIRERLDADPHPLENERYQVPDPRPTKAQITTAVTASTTVADIKVAVLQILQRLT